ncbi:MAG: InlB B-repeat-containing protein [Clostridiales bacterium]|nr:InlB B-repeat-containing protein [Clostridiales bacterium]
MKTKTCLKKTLSMFLCMAMLFSLTLGNFNVSADVIKDPAESWAAYLNRVYQERYDKFLALREKNADNNVPEEEVWTGNQVAATDDDGNGLVDVYTAAQLRWALVNRKSLELMNDVDLGGRNNVTWSPVANPGDITFEGNGYTIYNMNCSGSAKVGFISETTRSFSSNFNMQNVRFRYCYTQNGGQYTGTVIGWMGGGHMTQVSVEDSVVHGTSHTGGIMSAWDSTGDANLQKFYVEMNQCHVRNISVYGTSCVGSFVGPVSGCKITNCYGIDSYDISTSTHSGGFVSCPGYCYVENCFTNVKLYCNQDGGVFYGIGHLRNYFKNCFSAGVVEGTSNVGGFLGRDEADTDTCINCYSTSMVGMQNNASNMGGFYGGSTANTRIQNCYSAGEVGTTKTVAPNASIGGFGGNNPTQACFTNCYYDKQTSGMGEYAIATTPHTSMTGIAGQLTGQMIGFAMYDKFGQEGWFYQDGMYPQLSVFADADETFGNENDQAIARAYSAASVCTALLQPSNLGKTQEELENYPADQYDTVRDISVLFPLTNNALAGYEPNNGADPSISWTVRDGYTCQIEGEMKGLPVITIDSKTYEVTNFAPGTGWVDVAVDTGIVNAQNGENIVGERFLRLVPTTVISLASSAGVDKVIYVAKDNRLDKDDISYDHRENVTFAAGSALDLDQLKIKTFAYPEDDTTFGYEKDGTPKGIQVTGEGMSGLILVVVYKLNPDTGEFEELDFATNESMQKLLLRQRDAEEADIGKYRLEYRWFTANTLSGGYITNSKLLTVRNALQLSYDWNHPDHQEDSLIYQDDYPYVIDQAVKDGDNHLPEDPETKGYTFKGWSTDPDADPSSFTPFTADTPLQDDTVVYAIWQINQYNVSIVKNGRGTISGTGTYNYGDTAKVTWQPEDGWYTNQVIVDGVIRDDLLDANEFIFDKVEDDHTVYVEFGTEKKVVKEDHYQITTTRTGGDSTCSVSNSLSVKSGEDATITWSCGAGYKVTKVLVDGVLVDTAQNGSYTFQGIKRDHNVEVVFESQKDPDIAHAVDGYATVTTSKQGAGTVSPSSSVQNNGSYTVNWQPDTGYKVTKVIIDGVEYTDESILTKGEFTIFPVEHDRTIEVIFEPDPDSPDKPDPIEPGATSNAYTIETLITGGPGTITPGAVIEVITPPDSDPEQKDYTVSWEVKDQRYKIKDIYVDDQSIKDGDTVDTEFAFENIDSDHKVLVVLEPNLFQVKTMVEGQGTITAGATLFWGENYQVNYAPAEGWELKQVYIDGAPQIVDTPEEVLPTFAHGILALSDEATGADNAPIDFNAIDQDHIVKVVYAKTGEPDEPTQTHSLSTSIVGGVGTITPGAVLADGSSYTIDWTVADGYTLESVVVKVNGVAKDGMVSGNQVIIDDLSDDIEVIVTLRPSNSLVDPTPGDDTPAYTIYTSIQKGAGTITPTLGGVAEGSSQTVYWTFGDDSAIRTIYVDGVVRDDLLKAGEFTFENITADHTVEIFIKEDPNGTGGVVDKENYRVTTSQSGQGEISDSTIVTKGDTAVVTWTPAPGYQVSKVVIDGAEKNDLIDAGSVTLNNIGADHTVFVEFTKIDATDPGGDTPDPLPTHNITTTVQGEGSISSSAIVEEGEAKTIRWSPKDGHEVTAVIVDGVIRDDLLEAGEISFTDIDKDHSVEVIFTPESGDNPPVDPPVDPPVPVDPDAEPQVQIKTSTSGQGTISDTKIVKVGDSYVVSWEAADGWKVGGVLIDGLNADSLTEAGQVTLNEITTNHTVHVIFVPADDREPGKAYRIDTELVGGKGTITPSCEAQEGGDYTVTWEVDEAYEVISVTVDGVERPDLVAPAAKARSLATGSITFESIDKDHSVRVVLQKIPPIYQITTELTGGKGTITPSVDVRKGEDFTVTWEADEAYEVISVIVDGAERPDLLTAGSITFDEADADHSVQVVLKRIPGIFEITTELTGGKGSITTSGNVQEGEDFTVTWEADEGYEVAKVLIDGVERPDLLKAGSITFDGADADHSVQVILQEASTDPEEKDPTDDQDPPQTGYKPPLAGWIFIMLLSATGALTMLFGTNTKKRRYK